MKSFILLALAFQTWSLVGNYQVSASPTAGSEKGFVSSITALPEYAAWVQLTEWDAAR